MGIKCKKKARDGHLIFCYGDCNRKFEEALSASRASISDLKMKRHHDDFNGSTNSLVARGGEGGETSGQDRQLQDEQQHNQLMKKFWLEIYNRHYKYKQK